METTTTPRPDGARILAEVVRLLETVPPDDPYGKLAGIAANLIAPVLEVPQVACPTIAVQRNGSSTKGE